MASRYVAAVIALLFVSLISAVSVSLIVPPSALIPNPNTLIPSTSATLTSLGRTFTAPIQRDNRFTFRNITTGSYLLDIHCRDYVFAPLRLDIGNDNVEVWQTFRGHEWDNKGEKLLERPIQLKALAQKDYYEHRAGFSPLSLLKNPMILLAVVGLALVVGMPYMIDSMDPEMRAEFEEQRKKSPLGGGAAAANPLQNFDMAAWMAGSSGKKDSKEKETDSTLRRRG